MAQRATTIYTDVCCSIRREENLCSWLVNLYGSLVAVDPQAVAMAASSCDS